MGGGPAPYAAWASRDRSAAADAALQPGAAASSSNLYQVAFSARQRRATRRQADGGTDRDGFIDQHGIRAGTPDLRVIVLDGDGSILMNLGSLATDRACGVTNLVHIIWDNGGWEITGGQPAGSPFGIDLKVVAVAVAVALVRTATSCGFVLIRR